MTLTRTIAFAPDLFGMIDSSAKGFGTLIVRFYQGGSTVSRLRIQIEIAVLDVIVSGLTQQTRRIYLALHMSLEDFLA